MSDIELTPQELKILNVLTEVQNLFVTLPIQHSSHQLEFSLGVHYLQRLVLSRPVSRDKGWGNREVYWDEQDEAG